MIRHCALLLVIVALCVGTLRAQEAPPLVVFAASSLTDAFEEIAVAFAARYPETDILFNFAGSSELAAQLAEGAPADLFASANVRQMAVVREVGRIAAEPAIFTRNRLMLIVPADNPARIRDLDDLEDAGVQLIVAAPGVPIREYTDALLERLAADPLYGESYRAAVLANIVSEEQNVRQVAAKIALGEGDAGIVYASDVTPDLTDVVIALPIPDELNTFAEYPIAIPDDAENPAAARAFIAFLLSDEGQAILTRWQFSPLTSTEAP
jgi:molybdate transport system substrate-binding protein